MNALHAQENVNTASDDAMLQREAQIELQKKTGETFPIDDDVHDPDAAASGDVVHLPPTSKEPSAPAAIEVLRRSIRDIPCPLLRLKFRVLGVHLRHVFFHCLHHEK